MGPVDRDAVFRVSEVKRGTDGTFLSMAGITDVPGGQLQQEALMCTVES
jgi:hypothetical protein